MALGASIGQTLFTIPRTGFGDDPLEVVRRSQGAPRSYSRRNARDSSDLAAPQKADEENGAHGLLHGGTTRHSYNTRCLFERLLLPHINCVIPQHSWRGYRARLPLRFAGDAGRVHRGQHESSAVARRDRKSDRSNLMPWEISLPSPSVCRKDNVTVRPQLNNLVGLRHLIEHAGARWHSHLCDGKRPRALRCDLSVRKCGPYPKVSQRRARFQGRSSFHNARSG